MKNASEGRAGKILLVDDDADFQNELRRMLVVNGIADVETVDNGVAALERIGCGGIAVLLLDMVMPGISGTELLKVISERYPSIPVIMITAVSDVVSIVNCIKIGAFDYLTKPLDSGRLFAAVTKALKFSELSSQNRQLRNYLLGEPLVRPEIFADIVAVNSRMKAIFKLVETVAVTEQPVLITGETGVGKELLARAVHAASGLPGEFVPVNVAGLDDVMFSDTIFGHKKGAFTGAADAREGLIRKAQGGTLFLDEIGDLSPDSQKSLLRLLQENEYYRLGSDVLYHSNARIVTASNRDFPAMIAAGTFRRDLYHRLTIHEIHIPPLRERRDDIPVLAQHFARRAALRFDREPPGLSFALRNMLSSYDFPGNVRELLNLVNNAVACNRSDELGVADFPGLAAVCGQSRGVVRVYQEGCFTVQAIFSAFPTLDEIERLFVAEALKVCEGSKATAAELLGITRPTLNKKLAAVDPAQEK